MLVDPARVAMSVEIDGGAATSFSERVAILEERTRPKQKSLLDRLKDRGGLVSLLAAVAYSFPIGLWDRFIVPEQTKRTQEIAELKNVVNHSTALMADGARALAGISDPYLYDVVGRAINTRLYVLM